MQRLLVVDTETGGLDPLEYSILSVGAVVWERRRVVAEIEVFVHENPILCDEEALQVNRVDLDWLEEHGKNPASTVSLLESFLAEYFGKPDNDHKVCLVGHNVQFDIGFLKRLYRLGGGDFSKRFSHRSVDTASVLQFLMLTGLMPLEQPSSTEAFAFFGIDAGDKRHTALGDARATAIMLDKLLDVACESVQST